MAMNVNLTPDQQKLIEQEIEAGRFQSADEVISEAFKALQEKGRASSLAKKDARRAVREMRAFVEQNRVSLEHVSLKQLIHEGHRM
jgi:putative addiction module CopG family antidote